MGLLADQLKANLEQMKARHAAYDAQTARMRAEVAGEAKRLQAAWRAMEEALS